MSNLLDYIRWRGDLPITTVPVGEVDGLILSQLAMIVWENWLGQGETRLISELADRLSVDRVGVGFTGDDDRRLMALATRSARFGPVRVCGYAHKFDEDAEMQFAAVSLLLPDGTLFVAFRGTDSTLVGWKEDFNMAYSKPVPAQEAAVYYLNAAAEWHSGPLRVGGHSKGGNLAVYASATADAAVRERIIAVYNNDGPGLSDKMNAKDLYARLEGKLFSFVPQSSIVGMLLSHPERYEVVKSDSVSVMQHNPYTWQVEGPRFARAPGLSKDSVYIEAVLKRWLSEVDEGQRGVLVDTLFSILGSTDAQRFGKDFWSSLVKNPKAMISAIQNVDPEARREISRLLAELASAAIRQKGDQKPPQE